MNREILDAIEEQTDLRYDSLADAAGWYGTTTAWREDFTANWNSTGPKRAVKRQLNRDKEAEEMAKAKIKIKVSDSGIVTLAASGDGYATLNALVEVLAATICEALPEHRLCGGYRYGSLCTPWQRPGRVQPGAFGQC